jgi:LacI family transcriptional regulator
MANIRDVAKHAGVAIATVSATLNETASVSDETRKRVWAAVEAVGYTPNAIARSLRLGKSRLIGIVLSAITNPFCAALVSSIEKEANAAGYSVIVCNSGDDRERELEVIAQLRGQHVAGILLLPSACDSDHARSLERRDMPPLVILDQKVAGLACDFVGTDNRGAMRMLTEYLIRLGHRRIALISGREGLWTSDERHQAFLEVMQENGVPVDMSLCVRGEYDGQLAYAATIPLITRSDRPTAIIGANNVMALGALQAIFDVGFQCPADISVAGIDDVPWSGLVRPRVTTVAQPVAEIGRTGLNWMLERIAAGTEISIPPRERIFQPQFIAGESCLDLRSAADGRRVSSKAAGSEAFLISS